MADFVIIPDSSSDLTKELRYRFDIPDYIKGIVYFPDGHWEFADHDWEKYDPKTFYESMTDKKTIYKTACAPVEDIISVYEKHLKEGKDILAITLSSALSGTYQTCEMVKAQLLEKYPERKIICVDSMRYSTALSLLVIMAAMKRQEGATLEETAEFPILRRFLERWLVSIPWPTLTATDSLRFWESSRVKRRLLTLL